MKNLLQSLFVTVCISFGGIAYAAPVDINQADAQTLADNLNGIGLAKAQAIIEYREANGAFASIDDLDKVKGIGSKTIESNRENLLLSTSAASESTQALQQ